MWSWATEMSVLKHACAEMDRYRPLIKGTPSYLRYTQGWDRREDFSVWSEIWSHGVRRVDFGEKREFPIFFGIRGQSADRGETSTDQKCQKSCFLRGTPYDFFSFCLFLEGPVFDENTLNNRILSKRFCKWLFCDSKKLKIAFRINILWSSAGFSYITKNQCGFTSISRYLMWSEESIFLDQKFTEYS